MAASNLEDLYQCQNFFGILTSQEAKTILKEALMKEEKRCTRRILFVHRHSKTYSLSIYEATAMVKLTSLGFSSKKIIATIFKSSFQKTLKSNRTWLRGVLH
jgi:hypothetical protein